LLCLVWRCFSPWLESPWWAVRRRLRPSFLDGWAAAVAVTAVAAMAAAADATAAIIVATAVVATAVAIAAAVVVIIVAMAVATVAAMAAAMAADAAAVAMSPARSKPPSARSRLRCRLKPPRSSFARASRRAHYLRAGCSPVSASRVNRQIERSGSFWDPIFLFAPLAARRSACTRRAARAGQAKMHGRGQR